MRRTLMIGLITLCLAGWGGSRFAHPRPSVAEEAELPLYPSGRLLNLLTLGQPTFLADVAWLQAIQYYGKHRMDDRRYPHAQHLFDVITRIDPKFQNAYLFGALVLEDESGGLDSPRALLTRGIRTCPDNWMLSFHRGFLEYLRGDRTIGALDMAAASRLPGAPPYVGRIAAHACGTAGSLELAIQIWGEIAQQSEDATVRAMAADRLADLKQQLSEGNRNGS